jgi:Leucine-rich repeat (LRR) protein
LYIAAYGLTYKRIGVYVYLLLSAIGLITTFIKILKIKSNHFLFRVNGWLFYGILIVACFFQWDILITQYNINVPAQIEKTYLVRLSDKTLPQLMALENNTEINKKEFINETYTSIETRYYNNLAMPPASYAQELSRKMYRFMETSKNSDWQSWYYKQIETIRALQDLNKQGLIKKIELSGANIHSLAPLRDFTKIESFQLNGNQINMSELSYFPSLKSLEIQYNNLTSLKGIHALPELEYLNISNNPIVDYSPLFELKHLKKIILNKGVTPKVLESLNSNFPGLIISFS